MVLHNMLILVDGDHLLLKDKELVTWRWGETVWDLIAWARKLKGERKQALKEEIGARGQHTYRHGNYGEICEGTLESVHA